jgi:hypothetical protein
MKMISWNKSVLATVLAAVAMGPQVFAQEGTGDAKPREAAATTLRNVEITLPVSGLTKENTEAAIAPLKTLTITEWVCPKCSDSRLSDGECKQCATKREQKNSPAFTDVKASAERQAVVLTLSPGAYTRLSTIETHLKKGKVDIQHDKLVLASPASVIFTGGASADDATRLDKAIRGAGNEEVTARYEPDSKEIRVLFAKTAPSWTKLNDLSSKLSDKPLKLADVYWTTRQPKS